MTIRIVLAEDSFLVREGVRLLIESEPELELVAVCEDFDSLVDAVAEHEPDILPRVAMVMLPHDWLTWRLTGRPVPDYTRRTMPVTITSLADQQ
jgi:hypothetical protein